MLDNVADKSTLIKPIITDEVYIYGVVTVQHS